MTTPSSIVPVDLSETTLDRSYDIIIGENVIEDAAFLIESRLGKRNCVVVSDSHVAPLYQELFESILSAGGHVVLKTLVVPAGEASKTFSQLEKLLTDMLALGIDRKTLILALGGGVVGDLAGLAASLAMRGLDFIQLPTTLLAHADSSVGGKTGIDTAYGKNTVGTFYQPRLVLSDVALLRTLPERELRAGYAEVVKYGLISDRSFFDWCKENGAKVLAGDSEAQAYAIKYSCAAKAKIVAQDEREGGQRALLNLGHTFGHALESATSFGSTLIHGEAVAIGSLMAMQMAMRMGLCPAKDYEGVRDHFAAVGLPLTPPPFAYDIDALIGFMAMDKKAENGNVTLVLPHGIGKSQIHKDVPRKEIAALWRDVLPL